jgi:hypothetical protein
MQMSNTPNTKLGSDPSALPPSGLDFDPAKMNNPTAK